ncbi:MAG: FAD:protein FMN transferase [Gemmatimonadales bacterium]|nr:FAD:protein FMN transferase [Gemmatimonadales bacterium]
MILALVPVLLASPLHLPVWVERQAYLMGTTLSVAVAAPTRTHGIRAIEDALSAVRRAENLLSTWRNDSEMSRLNHAGVGQSVVLSPALYHLLREAERWTRATDGAFDPAVGALNDAWDMRGVGRIPSAGELATARDATGMDRFAFTDTTRAVTRLSSRAWIDTGGFGKGAALRDALHQLRRHGIRSGMLNFGGKVLVFGPDQKGGDWVVPVAHPSKRAEPAVRLRLRDRSASTSGQSERYVTVAGRRLGHVLDPRTGAPIAPWGSVTAVAEDPAAADIISTALLVLGPEAGLRWAERRDDVGVLLLIERDGRLVPRWNRALEQFLIVDTTISAGG